MAEEMVVKTFRGADGRDYRLPVPAPPPEPPPPAMPSLTEMIDRLPTGVPVPYVQYGVWSDQQKQALDMVIASLSHLALFAQQITAIARRTNAQLIAIAARLDALDAKE